MTTDDAGGRLDYFYCGRCGTEYHGLECNDVHYSYRAANGDVYICPECKEESVA